MEELIVSLQKARLLALMRRVASGAIEFGDSDAMLLIGLAVGLELARLHPEAAATMLVELAPPPMEDMLEWVVNGSDRVDPSLPVN